MPNVIISKTAIVAALNNLKGREIQVSLTQSSYLIGYLALTDLFRKLDLSCHKQVLSGAYAVYGWMPTILKSPPTGSGASDLKRLVEAGRDKGNYLDLNAWKETLQAINNSVVGTSKFLHFSAPDVFPIWDSVVARSFGLSQWHQHARAKEYIAYFNAVHSWLLDPDSRLPENFRSALRPLKEAHNLGKLRQLELALFWEGQLSEPGETKTAKR
ncbi:hypothetical protein [Phyllobacterium chamaecytisi]|uniref:hypothetical protein n=1 Tax=Phyllobacterium chamaecytisi TaxID=2876082 RepID=UPI001CC92DA5|nr:hypothetical protein [Phyllobacterium sp. KW56]MBZ9603334.1 hypothetical protein [Phyllobacterium sp. KW56]